MGWTDRDPPGTELLIRVILWIIWGLEDTIFCTQCLIACMASLGVKITLLLQGVRFYPGQFLC